MLADGKLQRDRRFEHPWHRRPEMVQHPFGKTYPLFDDRVRPELAQTAFGLGGAEAAGRIGLHRFSGVAAHELAPILIYIKTAPAFVNHVSCKFTAARVAGHSYDRAP